MITAPLPKGTPVEYRANITHIEAYLNGGKHTQVMPIEGIGYYICATQSYRLVVHATWHEIELLGYGRIVAMSEEVSVLVP